MLWWMRVGTSASPNADETLTQSYIRFQISSLPCSIADSQPRCRWAAISRSASRSSSGRWTR